MKFGEVALVASKDENQHVLNFFSKQSHTKGAWGVNNFFPKKQILFVTLFFHFQPTLHGGAVHHHKIYRVNLSRFATKAKKHLLEWVFWAKKEAKIIDFGLWCNCPTSAIALFFAFLAYCVIMRHELAITYGSLKIDNAKISKFSNLLDSYNKDQNQWFLLFF